MDDSSVKHGAVSLDNWSNLKSELSWVLWHCVTALLRGSKNIRKLKHASLCEHCLTYLDGEVVLQTIVTGKQGESVVIIYFGKLEHAWITHYHHAAYPIPTVLCRSIAVLKVVTIKTGNFRRS